MIPPHHPIFTKANTDSKRSSKTDKVLSSDKLVSTLLADVLIKSHYLKLSDAYYKKIMARKKHMKFADTSDKFHLMHPVTFKLVLQMKKKITMINLQITREM